MRNEEMALTKVDSIRIFVELLASMAGSEYQSRKFDWDFNMAEETYHTESVNIQVDSNIRLFMCKTTPSPVKGQEYIYGFRILKWPSFLSWRFYDTGFVPLPMPMFELADQVWSMACGKDISV